MDYRYNRCLINICVQFRIKVHIKILNLIDVAMQLISRQNLNDLNRVAEPPITD